MKQQFIRIFSLFLAFLMLLGFGPVPARAADSISLPSPSDYFGSNPTITMDGEVTVYTYSSYSSYPEATVNKFVKDMEAKGLTLTNHGNWSDGDALRRMEWKKDAAVVLWWREKTKIVEVRVHPCVTLTSGTAGSSTGNTQIPLPMPKDYFNNPKENFYEEEYHVYRYTYKYSSFPSGEVENYKSALQQLGFDTHYQQKYSSGNVLCSIKMNDTQCLSFYFNKEEKRLLVNLFDEKLAEAGYVSSGSTYTPVKTVSIGTSPVKPIRTGPSVLELIEDCFGSYTSKTYDEENYKTVFLFSGSTTFPKSKFEKLKKYTESNGMKYFLHDFRSEKTMSVYHDVGSSLINGKWNKKTGEIKIEIHWEYIKKSGFFDANEIPEDSREPDPTIPPDGTKICGTCSGGKSCQACGGKGETKERIIGLIGQYSTKTCTTCYGLKKCPTCKGHGWVSK